MNIIIGFSRAKSAWAIGSTAIAAAEKRDYSHVYVRSYDAETSLQMVYQASHGYVNSMTLDNFIVDNIIAKEYRLETTITQYTDIMRFMKSNLGVPYSRLQLCLIAIKKLFHFEVNIRNGDSAEICSEFGARVVQLDGINVGTDLDFMTPSDIDRILRSNNVPMNI